ncbi:MAG: outer membrane protein transport protein, partial [Myxococcota bacterium]
GAGLAFQSQSTLTLDIRGDLPIVNAELNARLEHQFRGELESIRYPTIGMQIRATDRLDIGLVYRGEVELSNTIIAIANADVTGTTLDFDLISTSTSLFAPQQVSLALQYAILENLSVAFELTWMDWSSHPSLIADQEISLTVDILGDLGEIGALPPLPMNLHDTFVPRLGVEYRALEGTTNVDLRFGYVYENSPFPAQRGITNFVDNDKHTLSLGLGLGFGGLRPTLPGRIVVNAHALLSLLQDRDHLKDSLADSVGDYRSSGFLYGLGVDLSVVFE